MKHFLTVLAVLAMATPGLGLVTVQWSDFETGTNHGLGVVGTNLVNAGYGPPSSWALDGTTQTEGALSQAYRVPGSVADGDPSGGGWLIPDDGGGAFDATDWTAYVQALGGPAPTPNSPFEILVDIRIDADALSDYDTLKFEALHSAPSATWGVFDVLGSDPDGVWVQDFSVLTSQFDGAGALSFILIMESAFAVNNPFAGDAVFRFDNLRIVYEPEPASALLLLVGGLFLRRRR